MEKIEDEYKLILLIQQLRKKIAENIETKNLKTGLDDEFVNNKASPITKLPTTSLKFLKQNPFRKVAMKDQVVSRDDMKFESKRTKKVEKEDKPVTV